MSSIDNKDLHNIFDKIKKDKNNIELLFKSYNSLIKNIAFTITKNKEYSEDISQRVFIKIFEMDNSKFPSNYEASWIYSVTKNESINYLKQQKTTYDISLMYELKSDDKIDETIDKIDYNNIISKLTKKEQEIISLRIIGEFSFKEIAKILNKPIPTVQWTYYKSLNTLKTFILSMSMFFVTFITYSFTKNHTVAQDQTDLSNTLNTETSNTELPEIEEDSVLIENKEYTDYRDNVYPDFDQNTVYTNTIEPNTTIPSATDNNLYEYSHLFLCASGIFLTVTIILGIILAKQAFIKLKNKSY